MQLTITASAALRRALPAALVAALLAIAIGVGGAHATTAAALSGIPRLPHDEDERPSREDADYAQTIFTRRPVPLPRWLGGGKRKKRR